MLCRFAISAAVLGVMVQPALAHPGHDGNVGSFVAGLTHPLFGIDHVLAMLAVGLWAALLGGPALWRVPAAFVFCMAGGFALAMAGIGLPLVAPGIAVSVLVIGVLVVEIGRAHVCTPVPNARLV